MALNSAVLHGLPIEKTTRLQSPQLVIDTINFKDQDLKAYLRISDEIQRSWREKQLQETCQGSSYNTMKATMTRQEVFESTSVNDDQFLKAMEYETAYQAEQDHAALVSSLESLMKYFDEDINVRDESLIKTYSVMKLTKGKVAKAVASLRKKCHLIASPLNTSKTESTDIKANIKELKKLYESSVETVSSPSPKMMKSKSPKLARRTKVKQMALLINNKINSMVKSSSSDAASVDTESINSPTCTSTPRLKSPKTKTKFPAFVTKLPSPKPSPCFKRKHLLKSSNGISPMNSPITQRKQLQQQNSITSLAAENVFSQLSVKDKALLYNKFITDMSKQNPKFVKHARVLESNIKNEIQKGEVVFEKQDSVKSLRESFEARSAATTRTLDRVKTSKSKTLSDMTPKSREHEDILASNSSSSLSGNDVEDDLHVSNLTVVLKPSPKSKSYLKVYTKSSRKKKNVTFLEDISNIKSSSKRTQAMIRSSFCVEPLAPPKKIRRTLHECLEPDMFFQNPQLEKLFYYWLKEKNGVAFDISPLDKRNGIVEIVPKNSRYNALPPQQVNQILEAAIKKLESSNTKIPNVKPKAHKDEELVLESKGPTNKGAVNKIELPLDDQNSKGNELETEDSDLGVTAMAKTTSEESPTELVLPESSNSALKTMRKKKLRRSLSLKHEDSVVKANNKFSTDSDSDTKAQKSNLLSCTLPKTKKCGNYFKKLIFKTLNPASRSSQLTNEGSVFELDEALINQLNSPSKIRKAYTLTVVSSSSPQSESDCYDNDLPQTATMVKSRSWPSLLETGIENDSNLLKATLVAKKCVNLCKNSQQQSPQKQLTDSYIDQGFETASNHVESPTRLTRKPNDADNVKRSMPPFQSKSVQQKCVSEPETAQVHMIKSKLRNICFPRAKDGSVPHHNSISLNESYKFVSQNSLNNQLYSTVDVTYKVNTSQFWITAGDFTAAFTIQHYESEILIKLQNLFVARSLENKESHFGIDDHKFSLDSESAVAPDEIVRKIPKESNHTQYWFSTGDILMPFRGKQMPTGKIQRFFHYIREHILESGSLRYGIDSYEFSNTYQHTRESVSSWIPVMSPIKTSDLDQSDIDSEVYEHRRLFDSVSSNSDDLISYQPSVSPDNPYDNAQQLDLTKSPNVKQAMPDILNKLRTQQSKIKTLEERILNSPNTSVCRKLAGVKETTEGIENLGNILKAIDNIGQENGFKTCSFEQLESFMIFVSRYAELYLSNCTSHTENVLDMIAK